MSTESQIRETPTLPSAGRHYTVHEIAEMWRFSANLVRRLFEAEPGVLAIGEDGVATSRCESPHPSSSAFTPGCKGVRDEPLLPARKWREPAWM